MATQKKGTELAPVENFMIPDRYAGMTDEQKAELLDELGDFAEETALNFNMIKVPSGGQLAFIVQGDEDGDENYEKEIEAVIVFTHRLNGYWPNALGQSDDGNKAPDCSSMDGQTGVDRLTGEIKNCSTCPFNEFGSDRNGKGKACKNMRRLYLIRNNDPNLYMLSVPPTSVRDVNRQLTKIMATKSIPYTGLLIALKLQKTQNADGISYSKIVLEKRGVLPANIAAQAAAMRNEIKKQHVQAAITLDDYIAEPTTAPESDGFTDVAPSDLPFPG